MPRLGKFGMAIAVRESWETGRLQGAKELASGLWTSVSGANARAFEVDTVANNLANADTLGFKKDQATFKEYLSVAERENGSAEVPRGPIKDKDFHQLEGRDQAFVLNDGTYTNFRQGPLRVTNSPLDLAMDGPGFLEVSTPQGVRYTRNGGLKVAVDGRLVTSEGFPVLSSQPTGLAEQEGNRVPATALGLSVTGTPADPNVSGRFINLRDRGAHFSISDQGELFAGEERIAQVRVAEFKDTRMLRKAGSALFENRDPANVSAGPQRTIVRQGVLEGSNVNPIEEMTALIRANRQFEQDMKALKTYGDLMGRESNDIGKL